jgi:hypothetical protein
MIPDARRPPALYLEKIRQSFAPDSKFSEDWPSDR